ncbi:MAG: glutaredoxin family protein [Anaerolineales bacterium]
MSDLVMYTRSTPCYFVNLARRVLNEAAVPYREVFIDETPDARERVLTWTGFEAVPTLVVAPNGADTPALPPTHLPPGNSPRGIDRGSMITEPNESQLRAWLEKHELLPPTE